MTIDVHAHYVPPQILEVLRARGQDYGIAVDEQAARCPCLRYAHGHTVRPFFPRLLESESERIAAMDHVGIRRQVLALWADIFGYGMPIAQSEAWHRLMNDSLAAVSARHPERFSWFASGRCPMRHARRVNSSAAYANSVRSVVSSAPTSPDRISAICRSTNTGRRRKLSTCRCSSIPCRQPPCRAPDGMRST